MKEILPQRKEIRLKHYNYSAEGYYFITICIKDRLELLGKINVGVALLGDPNTSYKITLSKEGEIVKKHIEHCSNRITNVLIDEYVIMPNHIHFIMILTKRVAEDCDPYTIKNN